MMMKPRAAGSCCSCMAKLSSRALRSDSCMSPNSSNLRAEGCLSCAAAGLEKSRGPRAARMIVSLSNLPRLVISALSLISVVLSRPLLRRLWLARELLVAHGRVVDEGGHDGRGLLHVVGL